jgi:hypothetical protein
MIHQIQTLWPSLIPNHPQINAIHPISESRFHTVWKITTSDQHHFVLKHHLFAHLTKNKPYDLIDVETCVTSILLKENVSVPQILATHLEHGFTVYDWCGEETLDDHCQQHDPAPFTNKVIDTILNLERGFQKHTATLQPRIVPSNRLYRNYNIAYRRFTRSHPHTHTAISAQHICTLAKHLSTDTKNAIYAWPYRLQCTQHRTVSYKKTLHTRTIQNRIRLARTSFDTIHHQLRGPSCHRPYHRFNHATMRLYIRKKIGNTSLHICRSNPH